MFRAIESSKSRKVGICFFCSIPNPSINCVFSPLSYHLLLVYSPLGQIYGSFIRPKRSFLDTKPDIQKRHQNDTYNQCSIVFDRKRTKKNNKYMLLKKI